MLVDGSLRRPVRRSVERAVQELAVVSYAEIPTDLIIEPVAMLRLAEVFPAQAGAAIAGQGDSGLPAGNSTPLTDLTAV